MKKWTLILAGMLLVLAMCATAALAQDDRISVAVMDFEDVQIRSNQWWKERWEIGKQFTELITNSLVGKGNFRVIERTRLEEILREQDFQNMGGRIDESTATQLGKLLGVRLLILGSVTEFSMKGATGIALGPVGLGFQKASVKLSARVVDVQTGEILAVIRGEGTASGGTFAARLQGVAFATSEFQSTTLGKASMQAVNQLISELSAKVETNAAQLQGAVYAPKTSASVVALISGGVIINAGQNLGIRKGQTFQVFRLQYVPGLPDPVRIPVGTVKIISVDRAAAVATFTQRDTEVQEGDMVEAL